MSVFQCDECGCAENTACGWYHCRNMPSVTPKEYLGKKLCCVCQPQFYATGEKNEDYTGEWHNKFPRKFYPKGSMMTNNVGNLVPRPEQSQADNGACGE